jgi:hypothetical protein
MVMLELEEKCNVFPLQISVFLSLSLSLSLSVCVCVCTYNLDWT